MGVSSRAGQLGFAAPSFQDAGSLTRTLQPHAGRGRWLQAPPFPRVPATARQPCGLGFFRPPSTPSEGGGTAAWGTKEHSTHCGRVRAVVSGSFWDTLNLCLTF